MGATKKAKKSSVQDFAMSDLGIKCLLSDKIPQAEEVVQDVDDDGESIPVGWIRITVERVTPNPEYIETFQARENLIAMTIESALQGALAQGKMMTDEEKAASAFHLRQSFEAQFFAKLAGTPKYVKSVEEVWTAPPESSKQLQKAWDELADVLTIEIGASIDTEETTIEVKS